MNQVTSDTVFEEYTTEGGDYIPPDRWGRDHFTTLLYLETRCVDWGGLIDNPKMRCNSRLHRVFSAVMTHGPFAEGKDYPTRLRDGVEQQNHDDWSCLEDMVAAGYIKASYRQVVFDRAFGSHVARVEMLEPGIEVVAKIRKFKMEGGSAVRFTL